MSATIMYQLVKGTPLNIGGPSSFTDLMRRLFGEPPWTLTDHDTSRLETAALTTEDNEHRAALLELSEAAFKSGEIRVWAEY
jgi:hypothetical protein